MNDILKALNRNEEVEILYHGKVKGKIIPNKIKGNLKVLEHPFFGMLSREKETVEEKMKKLRSIRYYGI